MEAAMTPPGELVLTLGVVRMYRLRRWGDEITAVVEKQRPKVLTMGRHGRTCTLLGVGERAATELLRDWGEFSERSYLLFGVKLRYLFGLSPDTLEDKFSKTPPIVGYHLKWESVYDSGEDAGLVAIPNC
eukprot:scaffold155945_cov40-Cyclotella_meneghiniana.AAC.2